jgi:adenylate cyclase
MSEDFEDTETGLGSVQGVADWLMAKALSGGEMESLVEGCCQRLRAAGIPLLRASLAFRTLHPLFAAVSVNWHRDRGLNTTGHLHEVYATTEGWRNSPFFHMLETGIPFLRRRLSGAEAMVDFPVLEEFRDDGATDYLAYTVSFGNEPNDGILGSWATDRSSGFSDREINSLQRVQNRLSVACKIFINEEISRNIVSAYLGPDAGRQVLSGHMKRGDCETIHAVIWYSDMRRSTTLADTLPVEEFLEAINSYFECTAGAVLKNGGEVLRFIGDAVLAIFPIREGGLSEGDACEAALTAARQAQEMMAKINRTRVDIGEEELAFGLGLHLGDVMYGNIGVPERLEFSVIGRTANEVARIEDMTKPSGHAVLASGEFARHLPFTPKSLGHHEFRGVGHSIEVFALSDD